MGSRHAGAAPKFETLCNASVAPLTSPHLLPKCPAVYAMYGGRGRSRHVAYVGIGRSLRGRIEQHLVRRDSSVTTGASVVSLNPELVTGVAWWTRPDFEDADALLAAELVAFDVLDPVLRSRGGVREGARRLVADDAFRAGVERLLAEGPSGRLEMPTLSEALDRIAALEERLAELERRADG